jgi:glycerol-3-phosphate acyltransferase PlsY
MIVLKVIIILVEAYLFGSINSGVLVSRLLKNDDVRTKGSGNAGATNVARVYGFGFGLLTLLGDVMKTVIAALIGKWIMGDVGQTIACVGCLIGHAWPVFFQFKGGKAVSVGAGIIAVLDWRVLVLAVSLFLIIVVITRYVSLGSMCAAISFPILLAIMSHPQWYEEALAVWVACMVVFLHRANIKRLLSHSESKFVIKK